MNCARIKRILVDYSEDSLGDGKMRLVERHLSGCEACRAELEGIETLKESVRSLDAPERDAEFWSRFDDELTLRLARTEEEKFIHGPRRWALIPLAAAAAALIVVSLVMFGGADDDGVAPGVNVAVKSSEAPEVPAAPEVAEADEVDEVESAMAELEMLDDEMLDDILLAQADLSNGEIDWDADDMLSLIEEDLSEASEEMVLEGIYEQSVYDFLEDLSEEEFEEAYVGLASI